MAQAAARAHTKPSGRMRVWPVSTSTNPAASATRGRSCTPWPCRAGGVDWTDRSRDPDLLGGAVLEPALITAIRSDMVSASAWSWVT